MKLLIDGQWVDLTQEELKTIINRLEEIGTTMHPYTARHIDSAVLELKYYVDDEEGDADNEFK